MRFKCFKCKSWITKRGGSWKRVGAFWGEIYGVEKHMSGESFMSNLGESCETKREYT